MREQHNVAWGQTAPVLATAAALWLTGVVALPLIFGGQPTGIGSGIAWLGVAVLITVVLLALMPRLSRLLAAGLARLSAALASADAPSSATYSTPQLLVVARLLVLAAELLIVQAVLRRPIALVLGGDRQVATVEASIAAGALILILPLLAWTYQTTRPMIQAATLRALDAAIPTVGTAVLAEPATGGSHVAVSPRIGGKRSLSTRVAGRRTAISPSVGDTKLVSADDADRTVVSPRGGDKTVVSPRDADRTVVSPRDADKTVVSPPRTDDPHARGD